MRSMTIPQVETSRPLDADEDAFAAFLRVHPSLSAFAAALETRDRVLSLSLRAVFEMQGERLGPVAGALLGFAQAFYPADFVERYVARVQALGRMQRRFDQNPCVETLGDPAAAVERTDYDLALLLSIVTAHHRFEILQALERFYARAPRSGGRLACIGIGTGYELVLAARALRQWRIEGYDTDTRAHATTRALFDHFGLDAGGMTLGQAFAIDPPAEAARGAYDAMVLCELLEHVADPLAYLRAVRAGLRPEGRAFVTMAVRLAQEDHVFLYADAAACRAQIAEAGLLVEEELLTPASLFAFDPAERERHFVRGNYVAVVRAGA
jgi:SAM-dependent methyltransferase